MKNNNNKTTKITSTIIIILLCDIMAEREHAQYFNALPQVHTDHFDENQS